MSGCHNNLNPKYTSTFTAQPLHLTKTCQR